MADGQLGLVLIANRGEIARRVIRTCKKLGLGTLSVYTEVDALAPHVREATKSVCLGDSPREYTNAAKILEIIKEHGVTAVHPGYGFLSENSEFAQAVEALGAAWLGPTADIIEAFGLKHVARDLAKKAGVPILEGSGLVQTVDEAMAAANRVGYPVLIKATGGGGGMGIYICRSDAEVQAQFATSQKQGQSFFGNSGVFVEKYIEQARHIEVQIFGDGKGACAALGERECSIQRRHQKILEESPSPFVGDELREELVKAATALGASANYRSAGTVEFLMDQATSKFYFLEVNTRLQVEHGITELTHGGVDLVEMQLRLQVPTLPPLATPLEANIPPRSGWAIEVRVNGEDPAKDYRPCPGLFGEVTIPLDMEGVRVDTWLETGSEVSPYYDSLLAKVMVYAPTREEAAAKMAAALEATALKGVPTNLEFLRQLVVDANFLAGATTTRFLETFHFGPHAVEVLAPGLQTSVQDYPGRTHLWHVGVPPSGPMDHLSFRLANALVGNSPLEAGLEFSLSGPTLKFHADSLVALCGGHFAADLDGEPVKWWSSFPVKAGQILKLGQADGTTGLRGYLAVSGGFDVPMYLGSRATFPGGNFGGYQGRYLQAGDTLPLGKTVSEAKPTELPTQWMGEIGTANEEGGRTWKVGVLPGPHADPDFLTPGSMDVFYSSDYEVHYNSNRLGVRLNGPKPTWTRTDGGEGGSHPSNVHDHVYGIGAINMTGDMPVILMVDGPSLGGFVCCATVVTAELWKIGQLRPNDKIQWQKLTIADAYRKRYALDATVEAVRALACGEADMAALEARITAAMETPLPEMTTQPLLKKLEPSGDHPGAEYRLVGDRYVQVEYGPMELDLNLRVRVHALEQWLAAKGVKGLVETSPGVRSCMIEYDCTQITVPELMAVFAEAEAQLPPTKEMKLPSRIMHLPMAYEDSGVKDAISKYMRSARAEAPYLPSNIDYIAANNGLPGGADEVQSTIFDASYLVLGLGDVYLGAPCAVPVDPRHRLVTAKYNPARTFTLEGTVGIGGSYMCVYPMDSPGGYQLVGRTLPIWNTFGKVAPFNAEKPWLLEFFDQVRFFLVPEEELMQMRKDFTAGRYQLKIEETEFDMVQYNAMITELAPQIAEMKARQRAAQTVQLELEEESLARLAVAAAEKAANGGADGEEADGEFDESVYDKPGLVKVVSGFTANVWEVKVEVGQKVEADEVLVILEAMKMESPVAAPVAGTVVAVPAKPSTLASGGKLLVVIDTNAA